MNKAKRILERFSDGVTDDVNPHFVHIVKSKPWDLQKRIIGKAPKEFLVQEDLRNKTLLHSLAKHLTASDLPDLPDIKEVLNHPIVLERILSKPEKRKDSSSPLELALEKSNNYFISKYLWRTLTLNLRFLSHGHGSDRIFKTWAPEFSIFYKH